MVKRAWRVIPSAATTSAPPPSRSITQTACSTTAPSRTQVLGRQHHLPARGDDVLDDEKAASRHVTALAHLLGAVLLRLLAHEVGRQPGHRREHGGQRDAAELQPGQALGPLGHQRHQGVDDLGQQRGVGLEAVLVEVVVGRAARAQDEACRSDGRRRRRGRPTSRPHSARFPVNRGGSPHCGRCPRRSARDPAGSGGGPRTGASWPGPSSAATLVPAQHVAVDAERAGDAPHLDEQSGELDELLHGEAPALAVAPQLGEAELVAEVRPRSATSAKSSGAGRAALSSASMVPDALGPVARDTPRPR